MKKLFISVMVFLFIGSALLSSFSQANVIKGKILFDESHHQFWPSCIDGGLVDFAEELRDDGYQVDRLILEPITYEKLKNYKVFIFPNGFLGKYSFDEGVKLLTDEEISAIKRFVADGGGLVLFESGWSWVDYTGLPIEKAPINQIGKEFGIQLNGDVIFDPTDNYQHDEGCPIFHQPFIKEHQITKDVNTISNCGGLPSSLTITNPSAEVVISGDEDSYSGYRGEYYKKGEKPPFLATTEYGKGKVVFFGHVSFLSSVDDNKDGIKNLYEFDNKKLGLNIIDWLATTPTPMQTPPPPTPIVTPTPTPPPPPIPTATPYPEKTPTPIPPLPISLPPLSVIAVAALVIILITGFGIARKGKSTKTTKPQPPTEQPKPPAEPPQAKIVSAKPEPIREPAPKKLEQDINITSAFGYKGATIVHKIKVENSTSEPISDIKILLFVPEVFLLQEQEKHIGLLKTGESQTITFEIRPTGECGECEISGRVTYYDYASKKTKEVDIPTKTLSIVCPLLKLKKIDEETWRSVASELAKTEESTKEIDMPAKTFFEVTTDILKDMNMFMLPPSVTETPQLYRAIARFYAEGIKELKYAAQIEVVGGGKKSKLILKAWAEKEEALTGFFHGILDEIEKRVQIKGYIDDSIVQQFYHIGTIVKDSVVQRSTIGGGAGKKCPNCDREVSEDEKFCPTCGEQLK